MALLDINELLGAQASVPAPTQPTSPLQMAMDNMQQGNQTASGQIDKILSMLEARERRGTEPPWFQLAGAFLDPGRTGSFGESLGKAANVMGEAQARRSAEMLPMAQMRLQLLQQRQSMQNQAQAVNLLAQALGVKPDQALPALQSGQVSTRMITPEVYAAISQLSPDLGRTVANIFDMQSKNRAAAVEDLKAGANIAELTQKYGPAVLQSIPEVLRGPLGAGAAPAGAPSGAPAVPPSASPMGAAISAPPGAQTPPGAAPAQLPRVAVVGDPAQFLEKLRTIQDPTEKAAAIEAFKQQFPEVVQAAQATQAARTAPQAAPAVAAPTTDAGLPPAAQTEVQKSRLTEEDKKWQESKALIYNWEPTNLAGSDRRLRELYNIANNYPQIFGLMQQQGLLTALGAAAQEGIKIGNMGQISLPVNEFLTKVKLNKEEQAQLRRASQILADEFFERAKGYRSVLGPQMSNFDAELMNKPMATATDSAANIKYWVKGAILTNKQRDEIFRQLNQFEDQTQGRASARQFFNSPQYRDILNKYNQLYDQFTKQHSPAGE